MIFLDRPYVSDFFLNYLCESGRAVLRTPFTEELAGTCPSERPLNLVDDPDSVSVTEVQGDQELTLELRVAPDDMGKVIGRQGRVVKEIRVLMKAVAQRQGKKVSVEILD